jgi:choline dehydrogenase-like flavoprotein
LPATTISLVKALHFLVRDDEQPYIQDKPYSWIRGYQVGGRSLLWARQTQRWSDFDFEGPLVMALR